jgi:putative membrane-bound dehydrogenase-like protein
MRSPIEQAPIASGIVAMVFVAITAAQDRIPPSEPDFTVPPGFVVERVAGPPLVDRPIVGDFDDEGRLYVADSSGSSDRVEKQLADRPHRIVRLEDVDGDGKYDTSVIFADRMMLPEGAMWFDGSLYVAAPPSIWRLTDTTGDGVADEREEWFRGETLTGCANDLHGPYLGPDGWIYWTKGAFAEQTYAQDTRPSLVTRAAHVFRRRPGDSAIDVVMTGGMDNPVDVAFTPVGERILTATFVEHPHAGRRDGLLHAVYGGVYGKPHAVIDGHPRTGELMPVMCQLGPAVPAGLTRYASSVFGSDYRNTFFAAMFNVRKVTRHTLEPSGATFTTRDMDFLVSANRDFHPTDVIEDADGSLLVVDTGPWYKLCCPTSQIAKPQVLGAIYRVRRRDASGPDDPRGRALSWGTLSSADLAGRLDDPRVFVQRRALAQLAKSGEAAVPALVAALRESPAVDARRNAVWALTRIPGEGARAAVRVALDDPDDSVRHAAIHSAGLWRDDAAVLQIVLAGLRLPARPALQRVAAEALGRIGDARVVPDLIGAAALPADPVLEHSLTYALIQIADPAAIASVPTSAPRARRAALIALDQIGGGRVTPEVLIPLLDSVDPILRSTAWWIVMRHPEWGGPLAGFLQKQLADPSLGSAERDEHIQRLAQFAGHAAIQQIVAETVAVSRSPEARLAALRAMTAAFSTSVPPAARLKVLPAVWATALARTLATATDDTVRQVARLVRAAPTEKGTAGELAEALVRVARDRARASDVRLEALAASAATATIDAELFAFVRSALEPTAPAMLRGLSATVIERAPLGQSQLVALVPVLETIGPLELPRVLQAFDSPTVIREETLGLAVVAALGRSKMRSGLRAEVLRPRLDRYPESVKRAAEALLASVHQDSMKEAERLDALLTAARNGDIARGQAVFNGDKGACLSCHAIGYIGGRVGPDLTRIGQVRSDRDLVEAIAFPSASFARGYEPVVVRTRSGGERSGALRSDAPDEVVVSDVAGTEVRIPRADVLDMQAGTISLMPPGYGDLFTRQELADLVAFLRAAR